MSALEDRLAELAALPANWDSYGGRPMQPGIAERIAALVTALRGEPRISLTPDGGGHLTWGADEAVIVELNPDGSATALIEDSDLGPTPAQEAAFTELVQLGQEIERGGERVDCESCTCHPGRPGCALESEEA